MPYAVLLLAALLVAASPASATPSPARAGRAGRIGVPGAAGPWGPPLDPPLAVRRAFSPPAVRWGSGHRGVDLAARAGAVVRAAGAGTVTYAGNLAGRGVVVVRHGALRTTYEPVTALVGAGTAVRGGSAIATLDAGHGATSPPSALLHWGLLRGDTYLDPLLLLRRAPSRLVPVPRAAPPAARGAARAVRDSAATGRGDRDVPSPPGDRRHGTRARAPSDERSGPASPLALAAPAAAGAAGAALALALARSRHAPRDPGRAGRRAAGAPRRRRGVGLLRRFRRGPPRRQRRDGVRQRRPRAGEVGEVAVSRAGRRACRAAAGRPSCASDRCGSR